MAIIYPENGGDLPPQLVLFSIKILDSIPILSHLWRKTLPFGLADPPHGLFSYVHISDFNFAFPKLKDYNEVPGGIKDFLSASDTFLGDTTHPYTFPVVIVVAILLTYLKCHVMIHCKKLGKLLASKSHGKDWVLYNEERIVKFAEYCFRLMYHTLICCFGIWILYKDDWWRPSKGGTMNLWNGYPHHTLNPDFIWYRIIQCAYNVDALMSLFWISFDVSVDFGKFPRCFQIRWAETVRGDFNEMCIHHVVTNSLLFAVSRFRFARAEIAVLVTHDFSDITVDLSKIANFMRWKYTTIICFFVMMMAWIITRLWILPFEIWRSVIYESPLFVEASGVHPEIYHTFKPMFVGLVGGLVILHYIWFSMIVKIALLIVLKGETQDLTEHKKGEHVKSEGRNITWSEEKKVY